MTPACDVTNIASLEKVVKGCELSMPSFKGRIQESIVLKVSSPKEDSRYHKIFDIRTTKQNAIFDNMSFEEWKSSVKPKIQGSWNLHASLPKGMTFFIMLSPSTVLSALKAKPTMRRGTHTKTHLHDTESPWRPKVSWLRTKI